MSCFSFAELVGLARPRLEEMRRVGDSFANADSEEACVAFTRQVVLVEGAVAQTYAAAALMARKALAPDEEAAVWQEMGSFCQAALGTLAALKGKFPRCGTTQLYDKVLDYKLACDKRYQAVMEETACRTTSLPQGLFPGTI
jgi:hypothetical protein